MPSPKQYQVANLTSRFTTVNDKANSAFDIANSAYAQANAATSTGGGGYTQANNAYSAANTAQTTAQDAYGQANLAYTQANNAYLAANNSNLKLGGVVSGTLNITQDIIVGGNIYLEGNTTFINVATYSVEDSLIYLASNNSLTDSVDIGFMGGKNTSGTYSHTGFARDATDGKWKLFDGLAEEGHVGNVVDFANTSLATLVANVEASSILLSGNAVATNVSVSAAYGQANSAYSAANNRVLKAGDTMTGQLNISSGGLLVTGNVDIDSGTLFVDAVNNCVGIGTTNTSSKLHIVSGSAESTGFTLETTGSSGKTFFAVHKLGYVRLRSSDTNGAAVHLFDNAGSKRAEMGVGSDSKITWYSDALAATWLVFDGANNRVGIGTDDPRTPLYVRGDGTANNARAVIRIDNTGADKWSFISLPDAASGNDTSANNYYLIGRTSTFSNRTLSFHIPKASDYGSGSEPQIGFYSTGADLLFSVQATTGNAYVKGNIGIANTAPAVRLQIGNLSSTSTATPETLSLGGTFSSTAGANPKIRVWTDGANTMGFGVSSDQLDYIGTGSYSHVFYTNGSEKMRITGGGNVGIGTSPGNLLHLYSASNPFIRIQTGGGNYSYLRLDDGSSNGYLIKNVSADTTNGALAGALYTYTDNNKAFQHIHAGVPLFTILSNGNVGINTTSPSSRLDIAVSSTMGTYGPGTYNLRLRNTNTAETNSGAVEFIGHSGNATTPYPWATISAEKQTSAGDANYGGKLHLWTTSGGANGEANSGQYRRLTIDSAGNVGIGTVSPQGKQHNYIASRSTGFSAGDGTTWHDLIIQNPNNTQGAAVGIAFELNSSYHSNAGTGIAAVKSTASSDYGADMVFVTRPQSAGAAEQMRITSGGSVLIGTNGDPTSGGFTNTRVLIKQIANGGSGGGLHLESSGSENVTFFGFTGANAAFRIGTSYRSAGTYQPIEFYPGNTFALRLNTNGTVSIGTTSNSNSGKFEIAGSGIWDGACLTLNNTGTNGRIWSIFSTNSSFDQGAGKLLVYNTTGGTNALVIDSTNCVGVGTTNPATARLYVRGQGSGGFNTIFEDPVASGYCWIQIKATGGGSNSSWQIGSYNSGLNFYNDNNSAYRVFFGDNGNVGIGSTNPTNKLDVLGNMLVQGTQGFNATNETASLYIGDNASEIRAVYDGGLDFYQNGVFRMRIQGVTGNVGIATANPGQKLHVEGKVLINAGTGASTFDDLNIGGISGWSNTEAHRINFVYGTASSPTIFTTIESKYNSGTNLAELRFKNMYNSGVGTATIMALFGSGFVGINIESPYETGDIFRVQGVSAFVNNNAKAMSVGRNTSTGTLIEFFYGGAGGKGTISTDGTNVAYNTSSDRRLKLNIQPADSASSVIDNIQVVKHDWNTGKHTRYGVVAQDLYEVAPEAVSVGDPEDVETLRNPWGVDYSKLVPMLIKEIQELRARVALLESK